MPQSLSRILVHLIFSTKNRVPALGSEVRDDLYRYLAVVLQNHGCTPVRLGGTADHLHLLFSISRTLTVAKLVETVKTSSSKWLKTKGPELASFHWQAGSGAFSVSPSDTDRVAAYISNQEAHHRKMTFQEELRRCLDRYEVAYDEEHLWD